MITPPLIYSTVLLPGTVRSWGQRLLGPVMALIWLSAPGIVRPQAPDSLDLSFNASIDDANVSAVIAVAMQPDDKLVLSGRFYSVNGFEHRSVARLNADGSLDNGFNVSLYEYPPGLPRYIPAVAVQPDGKIVLGTYAPAGSNGIARVNADGSADEGFATGGSRLVGGVKIQADGKIIQVGDGVAPYGQGIRRQNTDGTDDRPFIINASASFGQANGILPQVAAVQPDGRIIVGVYFIPMSSVERDFVARLNSDGTLDGTFHADTNGRIDAVTLQPDGKVIVAGVFTEINGVSRNSVARLNADGTTDLGFLPAPSVKTVYALQPEGKMLAGSPNGIVRLKSDGSLDPGFNVTIGGGLTPGFGVTNDGGLVYSVFVQPDGKLVIGGHFSEVNGIARRGIARLNGNFPTVSVTAGSTSISRTAGEAGTVTFTRTGDLSRQIVVAFALAGPVVNGTDYMSPVTKKLKAGRASASIQIAPLPDGADGKVKLTLLPGAGYNVGGEARVKVRIVE